MTDPTTPDPSSTQSGVTPPAGTGAQPDALTMPPSATAAQPPATGDEAGAGQDETTRQGDGDQADPNRT